MLLEIGTQKSKTSSSIIPFSSFSVLPLSQMYFSHWVFPGFCWACRVFYIYWTLQITQYEGNNYGIWSHTDLNSSLGPSYKLLPLS
jgi:hypothetical protein